MSEQVNLGAQIEAMLIMAEEPMPAATLAEALGVPVEQVSAQLTELAEFYDETRRGFELRHVGNGWRYYTRPEHHALISAWVVEGQQAKLSQAALETLSVIAYLQPISRSRVSAVRGVNVDGVIRTLVARELIKEAGADEISGAALFVTTDLFLEKLGITSLIELPELAPHLPEAQALEAELAALAVEREAQAAPAVEDADPAEDDADPEPGDKTPSDEAATTDDVSARAEGDVLPLTPPHADDPHDDEPPPLAASLILTSDSEIPAPQPRLKPDHNSESLERHD